MSTTLLKIRRDRGAGPSRGSSSAASRRPNAGSGASRRYSSLWALHSALLALCAFVAPAATTAYVIGSIPPQQVAQASILTIQVKASSSTPASFNYTLDPGYPAPQGTIALDGSSGIFTYAPAKSDTFEFRVTFRSTVSGSTVDSQSVDIVPLPSLQPETDLIPDTAAIPDPASSDYLVVSQSQNPGQEWFNGSQRTTRNVEISGKTVVFDSGASQQYGNLYVRFNNTGQSNADIKNLTIYAETATFRSPLNLPGTNVVIYARHLRFEDTTGTASINTTPLPYITAAAQFADGLPGQNGGNISLHIGDVYSNPGNSKRLIANGGVGQSAGQGKAGNTGSPTFTPPTGSPITGYIPLTPVTNQPYSNLYVYFNDFPWLAQAQYQGPVVKAAAATTAACSAAYTAALKTPQVWLPPYPNAIYIAVWNGSLGNHVWPGDGQDALPGGRPGDAGAGGAISSSVGSVAGLVLQGGGSGGGKAGPQPGGGAGQPNPAVWISWSQNVQVVASTGKGSAGQSKYFYCATDEHSSQPGKDFVPPSANIAAGAAGAFTALSGQEAQWLHPYLLRQVISQAKDAYRGGNFAYAQSIFSDYLDLLNNYGVPPSAFALPFQQAQQEMQELLYRINSHVDYFGHGAGWVPLLSIEAELQAYQSDIDSEIPQIYLGEYIKNKALQNQKDLSALQDTISSLTVDINQNGSAVNTALQSVPGLQLQAQQVVVQTQSVESAIQGREAQLLQKATNDVNVRNSKPAWEQDLKILGTIASAASVVYPPLAAVGAGLTLISSVDSNTAWQDVTAAADLAKGITSVDLGGASTGISDVLSKVSNGISQFTSESLSKEAADLQAATQTVNTFIATSSKTVAGGSISDAAINQEYQSLLAQDPTLKDLTSQLTALMAQKTALAQAMQQTMQTISTGTSAIGTDLSSIASVEQNVNTTATQIDHGMVVYVQDMERRAKERLLRYQYYMAKAYEYRMLQPYPGNLNIQSVVDKVLAVMASDGYPASATNLAAIKSVYTDSVRQIIFAALNQLQTQPPERSLPFLFNLTGDQLNTLNQSGNLTLDLSPLIAGLPNEDNRHIADLSVANMTVQTSSTLGPVARVRLVVNDQGQSVETLAGHQYQFYFGNSPDDQPFTWGASYNLPSGPLSQEQLSVSGLSLLQSLLGITSNTDPLTQALALFARPGADAVVTISKAQDPANLGAQITSLQMSITVDFFRTASNQVKLSVQTANGGLPYIKVDHPDVTGRTDGLGTFLRTYHAGDSVTLQADPDYGALKFVKFIDGAGNVLGTSSTLSLTLNTSVAVQPVYASSATTITTLTSSANPSSSSQSVTLTATVSPSIATGTVTFKDGTTIIGTSALSVGTATMTTSTLATGSHSLTAVYGGDANDVASVSSVLTQTVNAARANTTTSLTSSPNPSISGRSITLSATVSPAASSGSVTFKDGAVVIGTSTLSSGMATMATSTLAAGSHSLTAVYGGDANNASSTSSVVSQTVGAASATTTTSLTSSPNPSTPGQPVSLTATVSAAAAVTGSVTFKDGNTVLGTSTLSSGMATMATSTLAAGSHSLTAVYSGDTKNATSTSRVLTQTVNASPDITIAGVPPSATVGVPYSFQFAASGGTAPYNFSLMSNTFGAFTGLSVSVDGILGGTPTATGNSSFTIQVKDAKGATGSLTSSITVHDVGGGAHTYYFSQLAFGGSWQTTLTFINYSAQEVTCTTSFHSDGGGALALPFGRGTLSTRSDILPPGGSVHDQTTAPLTAPAAQGWAEASCTGPVQANVLYRLFNKAGAAVGEASLNAEATPTAKFVTFAQTQAGFAIANPSTTQPALVTVTAIDSKGVPLGSKSITLGPLAHSAANIGPLLGLSSFVGSVQITSTVPIISLTLNAEAFPVFSALPPGDLTGSETSGTAHAYYFSQLAFGGGWQTTLTFINYSNQPVTCTTTFYSDSGGALALPFSQGTLSTRSDVLPPGGSVHDQTTATLTASASEGWAQASCTGPVQANVLYRLFDESGPAVGEASLNAEATPSSRFVTFAQTNAGIAYANPSPTQTAFITITAVDAAGAPLGSKSISLGPLAHSAANIGPLLGLSSFVGSVQITSTIPIISLTLNAEAFPVFSALPPGDLPGTVIP